MELRNYTRTIVTNKLDEVIAENSMKCTCDKCRLDVLAIALNSLPSKYVVTNTGECYAKINSYESQSVVDVVRAISNAVSIVSKSPRHSDDDKKD